MNREEKLALADALAAQLKHTGAPLFLTTTTVNEVVAALRSPSPASGEAGRVNMSGTDLIPLEEVRTIVAYLAYLSSPSAHGAKVAGLNEAAKAALRATPSQPGIELREVLKVTRQMIRGQLIEGAVVDVQSMQSLGDFIDAALKATEGAVTQPAADRGTP